MSNPAQIGHLDPADIQYSADQGTLGYAAKSEGFARKEGDRLSMAVTPGMRLTSTYASLSQRTRDVRILSFATVDDSFVIKLPPGNKLKTGPTPSQGSSMSQTSVQFPSDCPPSAVITEPLM